MPAGTNPIDQKQATAVGPDPGDAGLRPSWKKIALLVIGAGVLLTIVYYSPLRQYLDRWQEVSDRIRSYGTMAPLVVVAAVAVLVAVGFPRLLFCVIAGMALGFWSGLLWAQLGTLLGNYALFIAARAGGRDRAGRFLAGRTRLQGFLENRGALGVLLARQLPLPGLVINLACALLPIRHLDFIVGTIVGQLPQAIPCTLIGAGALQPSFNKSIGLVGAAVLILALGWIGMRSALRAARWR
jgi:uncharacterized membrane protein YdjX (TVP38/TMEM64 family)